MARHQTQSRARAAARTSPARPFDGGGHDHGACVVRAMEGAETVCARRGARLTALRRRVLELVWSSHVPVGAYDVLRRLGRERGGAAPPTVYRALDFLLGHGLIHRIESLNAFVGCARPGRAHAGQFLICAECGTIAEVEDARVDTAIARRAAALGFAVRHSTVEVEGVCQPCRRRRKVSLPMDGSHAP